MCMCGVFNFQIHLWVTYIFVMFIVYYLSYHHEDNEVKWNRLMIDYVILSVMLHDALLCLR